MSKNFEYYLIGDQYYPRVTTITDQLSKPGLIRWAANEERKMLLEAARGLYADVYALPERLSPFSFLSSLEARIGMVRAHVKALEKAQDIGTKAHELCEWYLRTKQDPRTPGGIASDTPPESLAAFRFFQAWFEEQGFIPIYVEFEVHSKAIFYAGTIDFLCHTKDGKRVLGDIKTANALYPEHDLQATAYAKALEEMGHSPIDLVYLIRLPKLASDPGVEVRLVDPGDHNWQAFLAAKAIWEWRFEAQRPKQSLVDAVREEQKRNWEASIEQQKAIATHQGELLEMAKVMDPKAIKDGLYQAREPLSDELQ